MTQCRTSAAFSTVSFDYPRVSPQGRQSQVGLRGFIEEARLFPERHRS